jgi:hypothetical protein
MPNLRQQTRPSAVWADSTKQIYKQLHVSSRKFSELQVNVRVKFQVFLSVLISVLCLTVISNS